jgi:hypothetical protein
MHDHKNVVVAVSYFVFLLLHGIEPSYPFCNKPSVSEVFISKYNVGCLYFFLLLRFFSLINFDGMEYIISEKCCLNGSKTNEIRTD